jgi:hypothetical protein
VNGEDDGVSSGRDTVWLSGAILTFLNKLLFPMLWFGGLGGLLLAVFAATGRIALAHGFEFIAVFVCGASIFIGWLTAHLQRVGYQGKDLVVANYWREARIPFQQIEAIEPVWWYWRRLVRIRFQCRTPFGSIVYYIPKWAAMRCFFEAPEERLKSIVWPDAS